MEQLNVVITRLSTVCPVSINSHLPCTTVVWRTSGSTFHNFIKNESNSKTQCITASFWWLNFLLLVSGNNAMWRFIESFHWFQKIYESRVHSLGYLYNQITHAWQYLQSKEYQIPDRYFCIRAILKGHHLKWPRNWVLLTLRF